MKTHLTKLCITIMLSLGLTGCMVNPTPNAGYFAMTPEQTQEVQQVAQQTQNANRAERREYMRDAAEIRAWESQNSRPVKRVIITPYY